MVPVQHHMAKQSLKPTEDGFAKLREGSLDGERRSGWRFEAAVEALEHAGG